MGCFADDTGLEVEALGGAPGVHSARYATDGHDFAANNRLLLKNLEGRANRRARFRTVISLLPGRRKSTFSEGSSRGASSTGKRGTRDSGSTAVPSDWIRPNLRADDHRGEERYHRARAVRKLAAYLHSVEK